MGSLMDKAKGAVKGAVGAATNDRDLEADGKVDQAKGHAKQAFENLKDTAKRVVADVKDTAAEKLRHNAEEAERTTEPRRS